MQESGGRGLDPMQAAEGSFNTKYPHEPNGIKDPEYSIQCGVQELKAALTSAEVESPIDMEHIKLALQGYNFGNGYISWAKTNYGGYSYANAVEFSTMQASRLGWSSYGDTQYVAHVLRYYPYGFLCMPYFIHQLLYFIHIVLIDVSGTVYPLCNLVQTGTDSSKLCIIISQITVIDIIYISI